MAVPYLDRMELGYAAADLSLCRGGAMTCAEVAAVGLPAVYVPLPHGNGEQRRNALPVVEAGGGLLVDDAELTRSGSSGRWSRCSRPRPARRDGGAPPRPAAATATRRWPTFVLDGRPRVGRPADVAA